MIPLSVTTGFVELPDISVPDEVDVGRHFCPPVGYRFIVLLAHNAETLPLPLASSGLKVFW
jgi:hypothetical protein